MADAQLRGFSQVPAVLLVKVSDRAVKLWAVLDCLQATEAEVRVERAALARLLDCSPSSLDRAVTELSRAGALSTSRAGRGAANRYSVLGRPGKRARGVVTGDDSGHGSAVTGDESRARGVVTGGERVSSPVTRKYFSEDQSARARGDDRARAWLAGLDEQARADQRERVIADLEGREDGLPPDWRDEPIAAVRRTYEARINAAVLADARECSRPAGAA